MTNRLGVIEINNYDEKKSFVNEIVENYEHELVTIKNENQLEEIDGLIISTNKMEDYIEVCHWLVVLRDRKPLFVWIISKEYDDDMKKLYSKLATNSIVEVVKSDIDNQYLLIQIKKAIDFQTKILTYKRDKPQGNIFSLDSQNLKCVVGDNEIHLTRTEFKLFTILYDNIGDAVSYKRLIEIIWPDADEMNYKYRLANIVFQLRKKLSRQTYLELQIVRTRGYLLSYK
ncbi:hypothetical protein IGL98_003270 [Enterococcus sp. DIV0840]|uniref:helix-turn-helix domain-containing protein n=1 Tax=unclassified Enterococcus TaxID=2608891 RepID=UPI001A8D6344|nr:helix-turn-helix domain-containing protein [Enterococcus sp. DIV0849a]MBO0436037.1 helix-turn-helix domain-containing protein [Enterococcus sp. DIV0849a]